MVNCLAWSTSMCIMLLLVQHDRYYHIASLRGNYRFCFAGPTHPHLWLASTTSSYLLCLQHKLFLFSRVVTQAWYLLWSAWLWDADVFD